MTQWEHCQSSDTPSDLMDEPSKHGMKCYLDETFALTSAHRTCCLFSPMGFSSSASNRKKKPQHRNEAFNAAGLEITLHTCMDWRTCTTHTTKTCKAYLHAENDFILIVLAVFCTQKLAHFFMLNKCLTSRTEFPQLYNIKWGQVEVCLCCTLRTTTVASSAAQARNMNFKITENK